MGDFSGHPEKKLQPLKDRKFIEIDRDNIDAVMKRMTPGLNLRVENTLKGDKSEMAVQVKFNSMEDFEPNNVAQQVPALKKLLDTRNKLRDLMTKVDLSDDLESVLEDVLKNTDQLAELRDELGLGESAGDDSPSNEESEGDQE